MAYNDKQLMAFTQIAYMDLDERVNAYKMEHPGVESVKLSDLNLTKEEKEKLAPFADPSEYENWSISATVNETGFGKSGMYACVIETSSTEPKEAAVAFRGSGDISDPESLINDWIQSDAGLVHSERTDQEKDVEEFLKKNKDLLSQYGSLAMTGHSLGGALADYATVKSVELGLDSKITQCANMDGPGHSKQFISKNEEALYKVRSKMVHYRWSRVGAQLWNISGTEKYIAVKNEFLDGTNAILQLSQHAPTSTVFNSDGSLKESPAYKKYCEERDLGRYSRLLDDSLSFINDVPIVGGILSQALKWGSLFSVDLLFVGWHLYEQSAQSWDYLWSEHFKAKRKREQAEKEAKKTPEEKAAEEADQSPGFYIDPKVYAELVTKTINTISMLDGLETDLQTVNKYTVPMEIINYVASPHGSTGDSGYDRKLSSQRKELKNVLENGAKIKEAASALYAIMDKMYSSLNGIRIYLDGTSRVFTEAEEDAISRVSAWPK